MIVIQAMTVCRLTFAETAYLKNSIRRIVATFSHVSQALADVWQLVARFRRVQSAAEALAIEKIAIDRGRGFPANNYRDEVIAQQQSRDIQSWSRILEIAIILELLPKNIAIEMMYEPLPI